MQVEVRREVEDLLRTMAIREHRSIREQASYFLDLKIRDEWSRLKEVIEAAEPIAEVA